MTPEEFAGKVREYAQGFGGSITSWGRTVQRNARVGGVPTSYHLSWLAMDVVYDNKPLLKDRRAKAAELGLKLVVEGDHDHIQARSRE